MRIRVYDCVSQMTGTGEEWLVDKAGNPIAVFVDGSMRCEILRPLFNEEVTKSPKVANPNG